MAQEDDATVEFSVKELLRDIATKVEGVSQKLDTKAEKSDVTDLQARVRIAEYKVEELLKFQAKQADINERMDTTLSHLTSEAASSQAVNNYRKWMIAISASVGVALTGTAVSALLQLTHR